MTTPRAFPLPFELTADDLPSVHLMYGIYSSKTGAGEEEVHLRGDGQVVLRRTASYTAPEQRLEGSLAVETFVRLLELLEDQRFAGLDDEYPSDRPGVRRVLELGSAGMSKRVAVDNDGPAAFERAVSALLFAASLARPEVLERRFFRTIGPL
jgi:hypothetical protein